MNVIVNVDKNWAIGCRGKLLFPISEDLKYFARLTTGKVVVMGRATLESFPGGRPLKNRENIVLSRKTFCASAEAAPAAQNQSAENLSYCASIAELEKLLASPRFAGYQPQDIFVIGGQSVYEQLLSRCGVAYITKVDAAAKEADSFFPNLDNMPEWRLAEKSEEKSAGNFTYTFCRYERTEKEKKG